MVGPEAGEGGAQREGGGDEHTKISSLLSTLSDLI